MGLSDSIKNSTVNVGHENGCWLIVFAFIASGFAIIAAGLIAGKTGKEMHDPLMIGILCILLDMCTGIVGTIIAVIICI